MDRKFILTAFGYAIAGLALGIYMAMSQDHGQKITHAHFMLVGFLLSFAYALCHRLWLAAPHKMICLVQYYAHQAGAMVLLIGLFLLYGGFVDVSVLDPILGIASLLVLVGMILMAILIKQAPQTA